MNHKLEILVGIGIAVCAVITLAFWLLNAGDINLGEISISLVAILLVVFASYILYDRIKNMKQGLPSKDERLILINYKAGFYGFIAAIWSAVGSNMTSIILFDKELRGGLVVAAVVIISGVVFALSYLIMYKKGE